MKGLVLTAEWRPKDGYEVTPAETRARRARLGNEAGTSRRWPSAASRPRARGRARRIDPQPLLWDLRGRHPYVRARRRWLPRPPVPGPAADRHRTRVRRRGRRGWRWRHARQARRPGCGGGPDQLRQVPCLPARGDEQLRVPRGSRLHARRRHGDAVGGPRAALLAADRRRGALRRGPRPTTSERSRSRRASSTTASSSGRAGSGRATASRCSAAGRSASPPSVSPPPSVPGAS